MRAVVDTNVLICFLQGKREAADELDRYDSIEVSAISAAELLVGPPSDEAEFAVDALLTACVLVPVFEPIAREAVFLRRTARGRFPDAIVWATARVRSALLVARDEGFAADAAEVRHPYRS